MPKSLWVTGAVLAALSAAGALAAEPVGDTVCVSCHTQPAARFHSESAHKKLACVQCHAGGAEHVADTRRRPQLSGDPQLCASCHEPKKKPAG